MRLHDVAVVLLNELVWLLIPMIVFLSVLCVLQFAFCLWQCEAKNTAEEDKEYAVCLRVYTDL